MSADAATPLTGDEIRLLLRQACEAAGSANAWAQQADVSQSLVSLTLAGQREPSASVAMALGYSRVVRYVPLRGRG